MQDLQEVTQEVHYENFRAERLANGAVAPKKTKWVSVLFGATFLLSQLSLVMRKPVFGVSDQVRHKPGCTKTEDDYRLEISDLGSKGIELSV